MLKFKGCRHTMPGDGAATARRRLRNFEEATADVSTSPHFVLGTVNMTLSHWDNGGLGFLRSLSKFVERFDRHRGHVRAEELSAPPRATPAFLFRRGVAIAIEEGADEGGRRVGEGVGSHQAEEGAVVGEQALDEVEEPAAVTGYADSARRDDNREWQKPDKPVEPEVIGRDLRRHASWISGLGSEGVFAPLGGRGDDAIGGAFNDDFVALAADLAEGAVGSDEMKGVVAVVHHLAGRDEVQSGLDAQGYCHRSKQVEEDVVRDRARND